VTLRTPFTPGDETMHLPTVDIVRDARQRLTVSQHFEEGEPKPYALFEYVPQVGRSQKFRVELRQCGRGAPFT
jgi:hypothetical protein